MTMMCRRFAVVVVVVAVEAVQMLTHYNHHRLISMDQGIRCRIRNRRSFLVLRARLLRLIYHLAIVCRRLILLR
uniref:Putative secreted protein n=1 Tax=Anopheles marajoara TaxID=58244 RepID=A0A2M4CDD6_9DIPT